MPGTLSTLRRMTRGTRWTLPSPVISAPARQSPFPKLPWTAANTRQHPQHNRLAETQRQLRRSCLYWFATVPRNPPSAPLVLTPPFQKGGFGEAVTKRLLSERSCPRSGLRIVLFPAAQLTLPQAWPRIALHSAIFSVALARKRPPLQAAFLCAGIFPNREG